MASGPYTSVMIAMYQPRIAHRMLGLLLFVLGLTLAAPAPAQMHRVTADGFTVQASTTDTGNISDDAARRFGIERGPGRAVLNVTVLDPDGRTVPAEIDVQAVNLAGMKRSIPVKSTAMQGWISYAGGYQYASSEVIDFVIHVRPERLGQAITLRFRDRLPLR